MLLARFLGQLGAVPVLRSGSQLDLQGVLTPEADIIHHKVKSLIVLVCLF